MESRKIPPHEILDRIEKKIFEKYSKEEFGFTSYGAHGLPRKRASPPHYLGMFVFHCGEITVRVLPQERKVFSIHIHGPAPGISSYPDSLAQVLMPFDHLPEMVFRLVQSAKATYSSKS